MAKITLKEFLQWVKNRCTFDCGNWICHISEYTDNAVRIVMTAYEDGEPVITWDNWYTVPIKLRECLTKNTIKEIIIG